MSARQQSDDLAWDRSDDLWDEALKQVRLSSQCRKVEAFAATMFGSSSAKFITPLVAGGFNVLYPIRLEGTDAVDVLVRLPLPDQPVFPEERVLAEAATATYIAKYTHLPVPQVFHYGVDSSLGPFMIIQDLKSRQNMSRALEKPRENTDETPVLNPNISEHKLKSLYTKLARCVLQLAQPTFTCIGALAETGSGSYKVAGRPITLNMSNMVQLSNIPKSIFPSESTTYNTADEWYVVLAEMQMATLVFQHNDMISSEDDCRKKYVARQLFRKLAKQGRLSSFGFAEDTWSARSKHALLSLPMPDGTSGFRLWCDDFRPANVLIDDNDDILGAVDWEFSYVAPTQFILDSPWWLLLDVPETWDGGIESWACIYEERLKIWISALEDVEQESSSESFLLSAYMRESWETGRFWLDYAARKSWAFDTIYWKYLDGKFFGECENDASTDEIWKTRLDLLSPEEQDAMELLVQTKVKESQERILVEWDAVEAKRHLSSFLLN